MSCSLVLVNAHPHTQIDRQLLTGYRLLAQTTELIKPLNGQRGVKSVTDDDVFVHVRRTQRGQRISRVRWPASTRPRHVTDVYTE